MTKDNVLWAPSLATCMHSYMDTVCKSHGSEDIKSQKYLGVFTLNINTAYICPERNMKIVQKCIALKSHSVLFKRYVRDMFQIQIYTWKECVST